LTPAEHRKRALVIRVLVREKGPLGISTIDANFLATLSRKKMSVGLIMLIILAANVIENVVLCN